MTASPIAPTWRPWVSMSIYLLAEVTAQTLMVALLVNRKRWVTLLKLRSPEISWVNAA